MNSVRRTVLALTAGVILTGSAAAQVTQINGAGATFPYPIYSKWFAEYSKLHPDVQINYQSIGSGGGHPPAHRTRPCSSARPTAR